MINRQMGATTTRIVPMTLNSRLAKNLREVIRMNPGPKGTVVKVVENSGVPILAGLAPNNPFKILYAQNLIAPSPQVNVKGCVVLKLYYIWQHAISVKSNRYKKEHHQIKSSKGLILGRHRGH